MTKMNNPDGLRWRPSLGLIFFTSNLILGIAGFAYLQWSESQTRVEIWVPNKDLPAYVLIETSDLAKKEVPGRAISTSVLREASKIQNRYTVTAISEGKPILKKQLGPELNQKRRDALQNVVLVGIPATPDMLLGGSLKAGDIVDLTLTILTSDDSPSRSSTLFPDILVLDIKQDTSSRSSPTPSSTLVVALPVSRHQEFATDRHKATFSIVKKF